nr:MAG TPA: hypothetical protein [Caudoviricetes sp.]
MVNMKRIEVVELYVKKRIEKLEQSQNEYKLNAAEITELKDVLDVIEQTQAKAKCINAGAVMEVKPQYKETACDHVYGR